MAAHISVIIPTHNRAQMVVEAVASALGQTHREAEIIVVDDGSTDDTQQRLEPFADRILRIRQENLGVSVARNAGIRAANGEYIAFLDSDDLWHPCKLDLQLAYLRANPEVALLACHVGKLPAQMHRWAWPVIDSSLIRLRAIGLKELAVKTEFATSTVVVRKSCLTSLGGFNPDFRSAEDRNLWIRLAARFPIRMHEVELVFLRASRHERLSEQTETTERNTLKMLDQVFLEVPELRGRTLLRRRAFSQAAYEAAKLYNEAANSSAALSRVCRSLALWPFHGRPGIDPRFKSLLVMFLRRLGLRRLPQRQRNPMNSRNNFQFESSIKSS